jgi:glycosyltransferase involved in cell wall biosynthesis
MEREQPPDVSVVIPTRRGGPYLDEAIESVFAQTTTNWELIVVFDGCDAELDGRWLADPRVRTIRQAHRGESVARNNGIAACRSDFVAFVDDDDRMLPQRLERQLDLMRSRPEVGLCHTQFIVIDQDGAKVQPGRSGDVQYAQLLRGDVRILMPTLLVRKAVLEAVGTFNSTLRTGQDLDVIYRVARESTLGFCAEVLTEYRRHGSNASGDQVQAGINLERILSVHLEWAVLNGRDADADAAREGLRWARRYGAMGELLKARGQWRSRETRQCAGSVVRAFRLSPGQAARDLVGNRPFLRRLARGD